MAENISAEIVIIGGGISPALAAWYYSVPGFDTVLIDHRHIGMGVLQQARLYCSVKWIPLHKLSIWWEKSMR